MSQTRIKSNMFRLVALLIAALLVCTCVPTASAAEGSCGANLNWSYSNGTLTITGSGDMTNFSESTMSPWYDYRGEITRIVLPEGLTGVGNLAFYQCDKVTTVTLPSGVKRVGDYAFADCTSLALLVLPEGLETIGRSAFECCESLVSIRLPSTLKTLSFQAFYRCRRLTGVSIPVGVTDLGMTVFAYCTSLVWAEINCPVTQVPEWFFYGCVNLATVELPSTVTEVDTYAFKGCESLSYVEYDGSGELAEFIYGDILRDEPKSGVTVSTSDGYEINSNNRVTENGADGSYTNQTTTGTQTENSTVGTVTTDTYRPDGSVGQTGTHIDATLDNQNGWSDVADAVQDAVTHDKNRTDAGSSSTGVEVDVYLTGDSQLTQDVLEQFAGQNIKLNIHTQDGTAWTVDCSRYTSGTVKGVLDLSYLLTPADQSMTDKLGGTASYLLKFNSDAEIDAQVSILLPVTHARQTATLYQKVGGKLEQLQSVLVEDNGLAAFWLASVDDGIDYYIAISIPTVTAQDTIVPDSLKTIYGINVEDSYPKYVITGRTSTWDLTFGQVSGIMLMGMIGAIIIVGTVMFLLNKRKLRRGYVPDEEEDC